jgi:hypothetical protein
MKKKIIFSCFFLFLYAKIYSQVLKDINETTRNVIDIFKPNRSSDIKTLDPVSKKEKELSSTFSNPNQVKICSELCVENLSKVNSKVTIEYKLTEERQQLLIMKKDKSCIYDIPFGIYTIKIYQDDKIIKKSDLRIDEQEQVNISIPE